MYWHWKVYYSYIREHVLSLVFELLTIAYGKSRTLGQLANSETNGFFITNLIKKKECPSPGATADVNI